MAQKLPFHSGIKYGASPGETAIIAILYADWFQQGRHLLPTLTGGSQANRMNRDMESP